MRGLAWAMSTALLNGSVSQRALAHNLRPSDTCALAQQFEPVDAFLWVDGVLGGHFATGAAVVESRGPRRVPLP